jgi:hypothetical protein
MSRTDRLVIGRNATLTFVFALVLPIFNVVNIFVRKNSAFLLQNSVLSL